MEERYIKIKNKKTQSESVGFVMIVLIVVIVGVIFLGIYLRGSKLRQVSADDAEIANFLLASSEYTTDCYKDYEPNYKKIKEIIEYCSYKKEISCPSGKNSCEVLNSSYIEMIGKFRPSGRINYYKITFFNEYENITAGEEPEKVEFMKIEEGNKTRCSLKRAGRNMISTNDGKIVFELEICPET